jgi:hypothetical protein
MDFRILKDFLGILIQETNHGKNPEQCMGQFQR